MAGLTAKEITDKRAEAIEVGEGQHKGLLVQEVHNGHIVNTYFEHRTYPKRAKAGEDKTK